MAMWTPTSLLNPALTIQHIVGQIGQNFQVQLHQCGGPSLYSYLPQKVRLEASPGKNSYSPHVDQWPGILSPQQQREA
jgi:hypothetical protein